MDELKLTIPEAQELLLLSQSSVYSWIDKGKLQSAETPGGKVIVISRKEAEEIRNFNMKSRRNKVARQVLQKISKMNLKRNTPVINAEITGKRRILKVLKSFSGCYFTADFKN